VDVRDSIGYRQDPQLGSGVGLTRRNGDYLSNSFSIQGDLEWTPKLSTVTAYTNDYSHYLDRLVNRTQERMVHELSHDFRFHLLPSTTLVFGGIYSYQDYFLIQRDSQSVTLNGGADYQVTPQFTLGGRAGATYTDFIGGGSDISPYGSVNANWTLGARSSVQFGYHHSISGTDVSNAFVQESDAIDFGGRYAITNKLTARAQVSYTIGQYDNKTLLSGNKFTENLMAGNLGLAYAYNKYLDFELGYIYTRVDSDVSNRGYDRNQFYIGVRGTY
jgi:hypothetical protein